MLRALPGVDVQVVDLATLSLQQQLEQVCQTDILVGEARRTCLLNLPIANNGSVSVCVPCIVLLQSLCSHRHFARQPCDVWCLPKGVACMYSLRLARASRNVVVMTQTAWGIISGMHGAAMAWTLLMPSHAAAVELWPRPDGVWRCYEHTSHWVGLLYRYLHYNQCSP